MRPRVVSIVEAGALFAGLVAMVVALAGFDWRLGLFLGGAFITLASLDLTRVRP